MRVVEEWSEYQVDGLGGEYDPSLYSPISAASPVSGPLDAVDQAGWARYRDEGFLPVADVLTRAQVADAIAGIDRLISGAEPAFRGIQWEAATRDMVGDMDLDQRRAHVRKLLYFVDYEPRLHAVAHDPAILAVVERILGGRPELFADQALLKPPGIGREKPWHQDKAFFDVPPGTPVVGLWLALDATDVDNGCMHVVPGSHHDGPVIHFTRRDFQICDTDVRRYEVAAVPLEPGGALVFDGLLHHGTPKNQSARRRWALQFHYAPADAMWRSSEERAVYKQQRLALFGSDGKDVTC